MSSIGPMLMSSSYGMWLNLMRLSLTRAILAPLIDSRSIPASSAPSATMSGPGIWTWAILWTLATTVAQQRTADRRRRMAVTWTTAPMENPLAFSEGTSTPTFAMSESRFGTHRPVTATAVETPIDETIGGTTLPDLDPEQLHDPEPQRVTSSTRYVDIVGPLHGKFFDDEETVTE